MDSPVVDPEAKAVVAQRVGFTLLTCAAVLPIAALVCPVFGLPGPSSNLLMGLLVAGIPEMLCLIAIAFLGKKGFPARSQPVSKLRYYAGLTYCLLNGLPMMLYAYTPHLMPSGTVKYIILIAADLGFIYSLFLMGGDFWEKFRRLFVWEAPIVSAEKETVVIPAPEDGV